MRPAAGLAALCVLALGCAAPEPQIDLEAARSALLEADRQWAAAYQTASNPAEAFVAMMEQDARLLPPEMPLAEGAPAIQAVIEQIESMPGMHVEWAPSTAEVSSAADLGFTVGTYQMQLESPEGQPIQIDGKYMTVWRKQADGSWKVIADMFNPNGPPAPAGAGEEEEPTS